MTATTSSLTRAFILLITLSLVLTVAADARPGPLWLGVVTFAAAFKTRIVLARYLGLGATSALNGFFAAAFLVLALVAGSILAFPTPVQTVAGGKPQLSATIGAPGANE